MEGLSGIAMPADEPSRALGDIAYDHVLKLILKGSLRAGTFLNERGFAERLSISRTPVREALNRLEGEGLVTRRARLVQVAQIDVRAFANILAVRSVLEVEAAGLAAGRITQAMAEPIRTAIWRLLDIAEPSADQHWEVDDLVHGSMAAASGNDLLATMIRDLRRRTHIFDTKVIPDRRRPGALEHLALIDALVIGDAERSRTLCGVHLHNVKSSILEQFSDNPDNPR